MSIAHARGQLTKGGCFLLSWQGSGRFGFDLIGGTRRLHSLGTGDPGSMSVMAILRQLVQRAFALLAQSRSGTSVFTERDKVRVNASFPPRCYVKADDQRHRRQPSSERITANGGQEEQHVVYHVSSAVKMEIEIEINQGRDYAYR
jgi:hypothetical protein